MEKKNDIKNELNEMSSKIADIENKECFKLPNGYFDTFSNTVLEEISRQEYNNNAKEISPDIHSHRIADDLLFVPNNYFQVLPQLVLDSLKNHIEKKSRFYHWIEYRVAAAATVIFFLGLIIYYNVIQPSTKYNNAKIHHSQVISIQHEIDQLNDIDAIEYLKENGHDVNAALVASLTESANLPEAVDYLKDEQTLNKCINKLK